MRLSLQAKYSIIILSIILSVVLVMSISLLVQLKISANEVMRLSSASMRTDLIKQLRKRGEILIGNTAEVLVNPMYQYDMETIRDISKAVRAQEDVLYIYIFDSSGKITHDGTKENRLLNLVVENAVSKNTLEERKLIFNVDNNVITLAMPIIIHDELLGGVEVGLSIKGIHEDIKKVEHNLKEIYDRNDRKTIITIVLITLILSVVGLILSLLIARTLSRPIKILSLFAEKIGMGEYNMTMPIRRSDEIGELAATFEKMSVDLNTTTVSKEYVDNILESMFNSLIVLSPEGLIEKANKAALNLLGYRESELIGKSIDTIFQRETPFELKGIPDLIEKGAIENTEDVYISKEGNDIPVIFSGTVMRKRGGMITGIVCVAQDITKLKHAEREIKVAYRELKEKQEQLIQSEKMASLGRLVTGVAHEINTPVGIAVTGSSHIVKEIMSLNREFDKNTLTKNKLKDYIFTIIEAGNLTLKNLNRTSDLIRSFKMVSADQSSGEERKFQLKSYLEDIIFTLKPELQKTSHTITINCPDEIEIECSPGALAQVVTNLVMNSIFHAYEDQEKGSIFIKVLKEKDHIILKYIDDGKGIPEQNLKKIFDPFFTTKRSHGGTGLGLHITYNIVNKALRGNITCESREGEGAIFIITMPA